jgi:LCP family protein required for cell wall assembly
MAKKKKKTIKIVAIVAALAVLVGAAWAWSVWARIYHAENGQYERDPAIEETPGITNILIVGMDSVGEKGRADSIIVMSINQATNEVALISIPRDSRVDIPGRGLDKINHAMAFGGIGLLRQTIETLTEVPIHQYVYTNFSGFQNIVDAMGGVTLNVERSVTTRDPITKQQVSLQPGPQKLDGERALSYVRFRKDGEGDFGRMRRQQQFLKAVAEQVLKTSPLRVPQLIEQLARHVRTDMTITQFAKFFGTSSRLNLDEVTAIQLKGTPAMINRVSYVVLDEAFLNDTVKRYLRWNQPEQTEQAS